MDESATHLLVAAQAQVRGGASRQAIVGFLRDQGATALQATKVVMALYSIPLGEAQAVISLDLEWKASLDNSDETMQEILRRLARGE